MILVCNTSPLIALAKIDRLSLLQNLGLEHILIPPMVQRESWGKISPERRGLHELEPVHTGDVDVEPEQVGGQR
jgi:predicted nucleic acid-binding protein